jgi:hypothetical protein
VGAAYNTIFNAAKVAIKGDQLHIVARVFAADQVNFNVGYNHARNVDFITPSGQNLDGYQSQPCPTRRSLIG